MGNFQVRQDQLQFYQDRQDKIYGKGTLYSSTKLPSCFIIKTTTILTDQHQFQLFSQIQNFQNIYLISLYGYAYGKTCQCQNGSIITRCVISYWQFLSFSLKNCIEYRRRIGVGFHESQVWHIIKACVNGYAAFERVNSYYQFKESHILLNQEGRARMSWMNIETRNKHLKYHKIQEQFRKAIDALNKNQVQSKIYEKQLRNNYFQQLLSKFWTNIVQQQYYPSPEQLYSISSFQFTHKINFSQSNIFSLGMMLLHICSLIAPYHNFYTYFAVDYSRINQVMITQLERCYSRQLLMLIGRMLCPNPAQRITFDNIRQNYSPMMRGQYGVNINMHRQNKKSMKQRPFIQHLK